MRKIPLIGSALLLCFIAAAPATSSAQVSVGVAITIGPPVLPVYEQPPLPGPDYVWTPGYWGYGSDGYFWVPGTWVLAPEPGLLWTPGYWSWASGGYVWNDGYWGPHVGFYGGINYGYGYVGVGYQGGYWDHGSFYYNRSVNNVSNTTNITNVYNKTVIVNNTTHVSYNGGSGGTTARPTAAEVTASHEQHTPPTPSQAQHVRAASTDRAQLASVNHGRPAVVATPKAGEFSGQGVVTTSRVTTPYHAVSNTAPARAATPTRATATPSAPAAHPEAAAPAHPQPATPAHREPATPAHAATPERVATPAHAAAPAHPAARSPHPATESGSHPAPHPSSQPKSAAEPKPMAEPKAAVQPKPAGQPKADNQHVTKAPASRPQAAPAEEKQKPES